MGSCEATVFGLGPTEQPARYASRIVAVEDRHRPPWKRFRIRFMYLYLSPLRSSRICVEVAGTRSSWLRGLACSNPNVCGTAIRDVVRKHASKSHARKRTTNAAPILHPTRPIGTPNQCANDTTMKLASRPSWELSVVQHSQVENRSATEPIAKKRKAPLGFEISGPSGIALEAIAWVFRVSVVGGSCPLKFLLGRPIGLLPIQALDRNACRTECM